MPELVGLVVGIEVCNRLFIGAATFSFDSEAVSITWLTRCVNKRANMAPVLLDSIEVRYVVPN